MKRICIAAGHTPDWVGCSKNGIKEYTTCRRIAGSLQNMLRERHDFEVFEVKGKLHEKVDEINSISPDCAIEIHLGNTNTSISGARAFYSDGRSRQLAEALLDGCEWILNSPSRFSGVGWWMKITPQMAREKYPDHKAKIDLFLAKTMCDAVIIEPFYISSQSDVELLGPQHNLVSLALYTGILRFFGGDYNGD
jgi:N-acetylmuramoyl-L-alanine amidase